jgi:hypothetical protein
MTDFYFEECEAGRTHCTSFGLVWMRAHSTNIPMPLFLNRQISETYSFSWMQIQTHRGSFKIQTMSIMKKTQPVVTEAWKEEKEVVALITEAMTRQENKQTQRLEYLRQELQEWLASKLQVHLLLNAGFAMGEQKTVGEVVHECLM